MTSLVPNFKEFCPWEFSEHESEKYSQAFQPCNGKFVRRLSNNSLQAHKINFSFLSKINEPGKSHPF